MTITTVQERPDSSAAVLLIAELDAQLNAMPYPQESRHALSVEQLVREGVIFFVTRYDDAPAACGGLKLFGSEYGEVKRMYVRPAYRGLGLGRMMLECLAEYARAQAVPLLRLETGLYQTDAIRLYQRYGFQRRSPFGDYREHPLSLYFEKQLS